MNGDVKCTMNLTLVSLSLVRLLNFITFSLIIFFFIFLLIFFSKLYNLNIAIF